ncbi:MAG: NeuD/PglB/VioB family sugar acetyltransferase [Candidatus Latescibacterota bacterium]|nr:MAG: NeuD/PglB/VioB family sugar acetyltransferase [Candidatus Latescibacterota bacterium]
MDVVKFLKYSTDRVVALLLVVLLAPLLLLVTLLLLLSGSPLVLEERIGERGRPFAMFRFRTLRRRSPLDGAGMQEEEPQKTAFGRLLEKTRIAGLPRLFNILIGEMSFVGPRAAHRQRADTYTARQGRRLLFRPGITGWEQVHERADGAAAERIELDLYYVDHYSPWLDFKTLWHTLIPRRRVRASAVPLAPSPGPENPAAAAGTQPPAVATTARARLRRRAADDALVVVGAGGLALAVIDAIELQGFFTIAGLVDDKTSRHGSTLLGHTVLGGREVLNREEIPGRAVVALGSPRGRESWFAQLEELDFDLPAIVHPTAVLGRDVEIASGSLLLAGVIVDAAARLCRGAILNTGSIVSPDCHVGEFGHLAPGARLAGGVRVGARTYVGIGASVAQGVAVGADAVIGANAAVVQPVPSGTTAVGVPARVVRGAAPAPRPTPNVAVRAGSH